MYKKFLWENINGLYMIYLFCIDWSILSYLSFIGGGIGVELVFMVMFSMIFSVFLVTLYIRISSFFFWVFLVDFFISDF